MGKIISLGIQKGGCGKTTTTAMISNILARKGYKVLAVDFDSQGNLTQMLTQNDPYDYVHKTVFEACKERNPRPYIVEISENLHLLPAEDFLSKFGHWIFTEFVKIMRQEKNKDIYAPSKVLKDTLEIVRDEYDYIMIDLPPNLGEQTINGMCASDYCMVMLQSEPFCKSALERYLETLENMIDQVNNKTRLLGIIISLIDLRYSMSQHILNETREEYGELVFESTIKRKARILEYSFEGIKDDSLKDDRDSTRNVCQLSRRNVKENKCRVKG